MPEMVSKIKHTYGGREFSEGDPVFIEDEHVVLLTALGRVEAAAAKPAPAPVAAEPVEPAAVEAPEPAREQAQTIAQEGLAADTKYYAKVGDFPAPQLFPGRRNNKRARA